jgi:hypothetical protein
MSENSCPLPLNLSFSFAIRRSLGIPALESRLRSVSTSPVWRVYHHVPVLIELWIWLSLFRDFDLFVYVFFGHVVRLICVVTIGLGHVFPEVFDSSIVVKQVVEIIGASRVTSAVRQYCCRHLCSMARRMYMQCALNCSSYVELNVQRVLEDAFHPKKSRPALPQNDLTTSTSDPRDGSFAINAPRLFVGFACQ